MNHIKISLLAWSMVLGQLVSAQGIQFEHGPFQETLDKAGKEGKLVFLDAYTTWCGPCKLLAKNTFPDSAVGAFFNKHFVAAKIDMEKGEGLDIAQRYGVNVYPTLIFTDAKGDIVHRAAGYFLPPAFLVLAEKALNPVTQLATLQKRYTAGERDQAFLLSFLNALAEAYDPQTGIIANKYLATQKDFGTDINMEIIARHVEDPTSPAFRYMVEHQEDFDKKYSKPNVDARIQGIFDQYIAANPGITLPEIDKLIRTAFPEDADLKASLFTMSWYRNHEDVPGFLAAAASHYEKYPTDDPDELNETAWIFYKNTDNKEYLQLAAKWAEKSIQINESFYNTDTAASLYAKLGEKKKAIKFAERAIELAAQSGDDASQTKALLESLK